MTDLITRLREAIDEDERAALAWLPFGNPDAAQRGHIARHDPARVLQEVAAKRVILELHQPPGPEYQQACATCSTETDYWPCGTVLVLAKVYGIEDTSEQPA